MFFAIISAKLLRVCRETYSVVQFIKHLSGVTDEMRWMLSHRPRENACPFQRNIKLIFFGCASFLAKCFIRG